MLATLRRSFRTKHATVVPYDSPTAEHVKLVRVRSKRDLDGTNVADYAVLTEKWRFFFRFLDINNDGVINCEDIDEMCANVFKAYNLMGCSRRSVKLQAALHSWWAIFKLDVGSTRTVATEDEFVCSMMRLYREKLPVFVAHIKQLSAAMFELLDMDGDGRITRREYILLFTAMGVKHTGYLGRVFDRLDEDRSGVLDPREVHKALADFFLDDDPDHSNAYIFKFPK